MCKEREREMCVYQSQSSHIDPKMSKAVPLLLGPHPPRTAPGLVAVGPAVLVPVAVAVLAVAVLAVAHLAVLLLWRDFGLLGSFLEVGIHRMVETENSNAYSSPMIFRIL